MEAKTKLEKIEVIEQLLNDIECDNLLNDKRLIPLWNNLNNIKMELIKLEQEERIKGGKK